MLKINRNITFLDPSSSDYIFDASMYSNCLFETSDNDLNNDIDYNKQEENDYIEDRVGYLLSLINLYYEKGISKIGHPELMEWIEEIESYGIKLIRRKDLNKYIK